MSNSPPSDEKPEGALDIPPQPPGVPFVAMNPEDLASDPVFSVLFAGMKNFWQGYYVCHAQLLRHLQNTKPELSEEERVQLTAKCAKAALLAAQKQPPTAKKVYENLRDICGPILRELGISEDEIAALEL